MKIYNIALPDSEHDTSYPVRAETPHEAANFYIEAYLANRLSVIEDELTENGVLRIQSVTQDTGGVGIMLYDQPEVSQVDLNDLPAWNDAVSRGFEPGMSPEDWVAEQADDSPAP